MNRPRVRIWTKISRAFALATSHHHCSRPLLIYRYGQKWITLVVSQPNVESWRISIDQTMFKNQCFNFITYFYPFDTLRRLHHVARTRMQTFNLGEVAVDSRTQIVGLTNVDNPPCSVLELIRTWCLRYYTRWALHNRGLFLCCLFCFHGL